MLVERKISTKINYDVLRDIEIDSGSTTDSTESRTSETEVVTPFNAPSGHMTPPTSGNPLTITRTPVRNRLPSLSSRKRGFPSFGSLSSHPLSVSHDAVATKRTKVEDSSMTSANAITLESVVDKKLKEFGGDPVGGDPAVPVPVAEEGETAELSDGEGDGEGFDDDEIDKLAYDDDPLLANSDYEDYDEYADSD